jgi:hypothetical protein
VVKHFLLFLGLSLFISSSWAVQFESSVDRKQIGEGESLTLTVRYNSNLLTEDPDFTPIKQQFSIYNQQRKSSFQFINGKSDSWTVWTLTLIPNRKGNLVIPALSFKGETSKAIQIHVNKIAENIKNKQQEVFFDTQTDITSAYVQGQILYTEKLYFSVNLDNSQLNEVKVDEAIVQALGEVKHYATQLNGRSLEVYERQFIITPQTSGEMIIPGPIYSGEISNGRWRAGRPIRITQPPIKVQVLPQPASFPTNATWLPAEAVELDYKWIGNPQQFTLGEPLTLQVDIKAKGLSSAQLPAMPLPDVEGLKYYPDQAASQDMTDGQGIIGTRSQSIAVVATRPGSLTLPEVRIPWWNTKLSKLEYAVIPAQRLTALTNGQTKAPDKEPIKPLEPQPSPLITAATETQEAHATPLLWPITSLCLFILWVATLALWWFKKPQQTAKANQPITKEKTSASLKDIKKACRANQGVMARKAILEYAQTQWGQTNTSLNELAKWVSDESLSQALVSLDASLYSQQADTNWQGEPLWQVFKHYQVPSIKAVSGIMPLYPNSANQVVSHG